MGGIAGSQSLALVIRAQALDQIGSSNSKLLILKESAIGLLNGIIWSALLQPLSIFGLTVSSWRCNCSCYYDQSYHWRYQRGESSTYFRETRYRSCSRRRCDLDNDYRCCRVRIFIGNCNFSNVSISIFR